MTYVDGENRVRIHDLGSTAAPESLDLTLPDGLHAVEVAATAARDLLVRSRLSGDATGTGNGSEVLFFVRSGQPAKRATSNAEIVGSEAVGGLDRDGRPIFVISQPADDGVCPEETVWIYQPDGAGLTRQNFVKGPSEGRHNVVTHLGDRWWDRQGRLNGMLSATACADDVHETAAPSSWWRWDRQGWVQIESQPMIAVRMLASGGRVELVLEDDLQVLYRRTAGARIQLASDVLALAAPPI